MSRIEDGGRSTFFRRVEIEREALRAVNARFPHRQRLQGVSPGAIATWMKVDAARPVPSRLVDRLLELSALLGRFADQSRTVFDGGPVSNKEIEAALREIAIAD